MSTNNPRTDPKPTSIYANNFGQGDRRSKASAAKQQLCESSVNIESIVVDLLLKPLVNRLIDMKDEIMNQENLYLFSDVRGLFGYIKEHHGGIFRKVLFSNMLEPLIKLKQDNQEREARLKAVGEKLSELEAMRRILMRQSEIEAAKTNKMRIVPVSLNFALSILVNSKFSC